MCQDVIRLHHVLAHWLTGRMTQTEEECVRFQHVLAEDFHLVHPTGTIQDKAAVTADSVTTRNSHVTHTRRKHTQKRRYVATSRRYSVSERGAT